MLRVILLLVLFIILSGCSDNKDVKIKTIKIKKVDTGWDTSILGNNVEGL